MDAFSRLLLALIALLLFVLVLGQVGVLRVPVAPQAPGSALSLAPDATSAGAASTEEGARFSLTPIRISPKAFFLIRIDQETGRTWKVNFPSTSAGWQEIAEGDEVRARRAARDAERKRKQQAADPAETP